MKPRAVLFWSGGKDSALALSRLQRTGEYEIAALITTVNAQYRRVSMHGVREELIAAQARAAGLPLDIMYVNSGTNDEYIAALRRTLGIWRDRGAETVAFGDIFLADLRQWREGLLAELGLRGVFPLWHADTAALAQEFVVDGFRALLCCANDAFLGEADVGRVMNAAFFATLPANIDPCGENGEYHSFVWDGPVFQTPVAFKRGEKVYRPLEATLPTAAAPAGDRAIPVPAAPGPTATKGFWFLDLLPA